MKEVVFSGHQPNFLPYMGIFYKIFKSDVFVFDDDVQYTSKKYMSNNGASIGHNSNIIRIGDNVGNITIPVSYEFGDKINEVRICNEKHWKKKILRTISCNYSKYPCFDLGYSLLEEAFSRDYDKLYDLNRYLLDEIIKGFNFKAKIVTASIDVPTELKSNDRNIFQCKTLGGTVYYSGAGGGKEYNDEEAYKANGIKLVYNDFKPCLLYTSPSPRD